MDAVAARCGDGHGCRACGGQLWGRGGCKATRLPVKLDNCRARTEYLNRQRTLLAGTQSSMMWTRRRLNVATVMAVTCAEINVGNAAAVKQRGNRLVCRALRGRVALSVQACEWRPPQDGVDVERDASSHPPLFLWRIDAHTFIETDLQDTLSVEALSVARAWRPGLVCCAGQGGTWPAPFCGARRPTLAHCSSQPRPDKVALSVLVGRMCQTMQCLTFRLGLLCQWRRRLASRLRTTLATPVQAALDWLLVTALSVLVWLGVMVTAWSRPC